MRNSTPKWNRYAACLSCTLSIGHAPLGMGGENMEDGLFALECGTKANVG